MTTNWEWGQNKTFVKAVPTVSRCFRSFVDERSPWCGTSDALVPHFWWFDFCLLIGHVMCWTSTWSSTKVIWIQLQMVLKDVLTAQRCRSSLVDRSPWFSTISMIWRVYGGTVWSSWFLDQNSSIIYVRKLLNRMKKMLNPIKWRNLFLMFIMLRCERSALFAPIFHR